MTFKFSKLGPGLLFAGAAIGVSHLVQSTKAGADFGFGLIWAILIVNFFKYPFFQFGPRYAYATKTSLLEGYLKLHKSVLIAYFILTIATMFTIQTAVTSVTAGLATTLFGINLPYNIWSVIILFFCFTILIRGKYKVLDQLMKIIIITLSITTLIAVITALKSKSTSINLTQVWPKNSEQVIFLIAFMGWMPAPLDISVWHSLWAIEKQKTSTNIKLKQSIFDFNIGYITTIILGIAFVSIGALILFESGNAFSSKASVFATQLINMYTEGIGNWAKLIIGIAAFTTMFSTTITTLDASPRALAQTSKLLFSKTNTLGYKFWMSTLMLGTIIILLFFQAEMGLLIKIATILSFLTAPFYALINYLAITGNEVSEQYKPSKLMHIWSWAGFLFLIGFSVWYTMAL
ncbi:MAG: iron transporter [Bacteroidetes bacterium MedPE-SWsnd-G2]|nr:MAG: iron transporter [Bacteroidetes bacterium MedPE-SWsnd-G2]